MKTLRLRLQNDHGDGVRAVTAQRLLRRRLRLTSPSHHLLRACTNTKEIPFDFFTMSRACLRLDETARRNSCHVLVLLAYVRWPGIRRCNGLCLRSEDVMTVSYASIMIKQVALMSSMRPSGRSALMPCWQTLVTANLILLSEVRRAHSYERLIEIW